MEEKENKDIENIEEEVITKMDNTIDVQSTFNTDTVEELNDKDVVLEHVDEDEIEGIGSADGFCARTGRPTGGIFYNNDNNHGASWCVNGNPKDARCNVLSNCVGYACGRFNEIIGSMKYPQLCCNAENFIERAKQYGLNVVNYPTLGGIMVWQKGATLSGNDGAGHVEVVERIDNANQIYTSASNWGGTTFYNATRNNSNGRWGLASGYKFRGCIVNPSIGDVHYTAPSNSQTKPSSASGKFKIGDEVIINGKLYVSSNATNPSSNISNKKTKIARYVAGAKHPYNTTGDLGWMDESSIASIEKPSSKGNYKTLGSMNVRTGAGTNYPVKKVSQLTADGKKNATSTNPNADAVYKTGTVFTAYEIINNNYGTWAKTPSGYVCIKGASGRVYCSKI